MRNKPPHYTQWVWSLFYDDKDKSRSPDSGDVIYLIFKHLFRLWSCLSIVWYAPLMLLALIVDYTSLYFVFPRLPREYDATKDWRGSLSSMELAASNRDPEGVDEREAVIT